MPSRAQHTVFRFRLQSLLAITAVTAVALAIVRPWLPRLDEFQWGHFYTAIAAVAAGMAASLLCAVLRRRAVGRHCGRLLLTLDDPPDPGIARVEAGLLAFGAVYGVGYLLFFGDPTNRDDFGAVFVPVVTLPFLFWCGTRLAIHALAWWVEGYRPAVEFCENGLVADSRFHRWDAANLRDVHWTTSGEGIVLCIRRYLLNTPVAPRTVAVPPEQREGVEAILELYYRSNRHDDH